MRFKDQAPQKEGRLTVLEGVSGLNLLAELLVLLGEGFTLGNHLAGHSKSAYRNRPEQSKTRLTLSISSWLSRPRSFSIVTEDDFPVPLSAAETFMMLSQVPKCQHLRVWWREKAYPEASISKVTSIWGTPRGAGGMPLSSNFPRWLLSRVMARSPS